MSLSEESYLTERRHDRTPIGVREEMRGNLREHTEEHLTPMIKIKTSVRKPELPGTVTRLELK